MRNGLASLYSGRYPRAIIYMLQQSEYQVGAYLKWFWRTTNFSRVEYRGSLRRTSSALLLLRALQTGMLLQVLAGLVLIFWQWRFAAPTLYFGLALIVSYPIVWAHLVVLPLLAGRWLVVWPRTQLRRRKAAEAFANYSGEKIAIIGSYGKTSMKELLRTVLGEGQKVAATPANKNVLVSHIAFARQLQGADIALIEYGEGAPGDIARFARLTYPTRAIITGIAPAHLDHYKTTAAAARDIFSIASYIADKTRIYVNMDSPFVRHHAGADSFAAYDERGALGWRVHGVEVAVTGMDLSVAKGSKRLRLHTQLVGRHHLGPLVLAVALAKELGLSDAQVQAGVAHTAPFEHRMQPYALNGGWVIDDTYNGNLEGIRAGTALLRELPATRKFYATPGLVDQGKETRDVHREMGRLIAKSGAQQVFLMHNSVTPYIQEGLAAGHFTGEVHVEDKPLEFYSNLSHLVAAGDLIMLQNDWPDNYR